MSDYNSLVRKKEELLFTKSNTERDLQGRRDSVDAIKNELEFINRDLDSSIKKASTEALKSEISKLTKPTEDKISDLYDKREILMSNKKKRIDSITYENYAESVDDSVSLDSCLEKCKDLFSKLEERQGSRLNGYLFDNIPAMEIDLNSLEDIELIFQDIDWKIGLMNKNFDVLGKLENLVYKHDVKDGSKGSIAIFIIVTLLVVFSFVYYSPILVLLMLILIGFNLYRYVFTYKCISLLNSISENLNQIKDSIEQGIYNKMEEDKQIIEAKFNSKLDKLDNALSSLESKLNEITRSVERDFKYDSSRLKESFVIKEKSLQDRIHLLESEIKSCEEGIQKIIEEVKEIDKEIVKISQSIFEQYYPKDISSKKVMYPNDMLLDIVNNEPKIFKLPKGSAILVFRDKELLFSFLNLYLCLLYSNVKCSSFKMFYYDDRYMGSESILYTSLKNFVLCTDKDEHKSVMSNLNSEMKKRIGLLADGDIDSYNEQMLREDSSPLSYNIMVDLFGDSAKIGDDYKQVVVNGHKRGVITLALMLEDEIDFKGSGPFWEMLDLFDEVYGYGARGLMKKSKSFFTNKLQK